MKANVTCIFFLLLCWAVTTTKVLQLNIHIMVGYKSKNINSIDNKFICPICNLIFRSPVQLLCGHRYCESCYSNTKCKLCKNVLSSNEVKFNFSISFEIIGSICFFECTHRYLKIEVCKMIWKYYKYVAIVVIGKVYLKIMK